MDIEGMKKKLAAMSPEKRMAGAVKLIGANDGVTQQAKHSFLMKVGFSSTEYLEALNRASNGELLRSV